MKFFYVTPFLLQKLIWLPTRLCLAFFTHLRVYGLENLKGIRENVVFVSNHTSELDAFILPSSLPFWSGFLPVFYVSRENKFYDTSGWRQHFYGGTFFKLFGAQPAYGGFKDYEKSLANQLKLVEDHKNLYVFPEGGITPDGTIQEVHGGVGYIVDKMSALVVPVGISGAFRVSLADFLLRRRHIVIRFGEPIHADELAVSVPGDAVADGNIYKAKAAYIMQRVREVLVGGGSRRPKSAIDVIDELEKIHSTEF